jgi:hypothetical protein
MSRPKPTIIKQVELNDGSTWDITQAECLYVITYLGQPIGIRQHINTMTTQGYKYQKLSYTSLGNAQAQVRRLNNKLNTEDFGYLKVM